MNLKYFSYGFMAMFGMFSVSDLIEENQIKSKNNISSYWNNVSLLMKKVFNEQSKKL